MTESEVPPFRPHPLIRGGHAQTLAGAFWPEALPTLEPIEHRVVLADGDQIALHEDRPNIQPASVAGLRPAQTPAPHAVLLIHGLGGNRHSGYVQRLAGRLTERGLTAWRMELRGCGAGRGLAQRPYHAGRSDDVREALEFIAAAMPGAAVSAIGFSLGGNMLLKLLGEWGDAPPEWFRRASAVCPPTDLLAGSRYLTRAVSRWYDRYFVRKLLEQFAGQQFPAAAIAEILQHRPRTLAEFDDRFTAPLSGFAGVDEYYRTQASGPLLGRITVPTLIIASTDDPVVPASNFSAWPCSRAVRLELQSSGGHLGFLARSLNNGKLRWMDRRLLAWIDG